MAYISGNISHDGRILVYDANSGALDHNELFSAGPYEILGLDGSAKVVTAVRSSNGESISYGDVHPIDEGYDWGLFTGDDFNGTNGDPPNETYWDVIGTYTQFDIQSNQLYQECADGEDSHLDSNFEVSGDFDIRVDCLRDVYPWQGSGWWQFQFRAIVDDNDYMTIARGVQGNDHTFWATGKNNGVSFNETQNQNFTDFTLRIVRSGSTWTCYWNANLMTTQNSMSTSPIYVTIGCNSGNYNQGTARSQYWDDFQLVQGTASAR